MIRLGQKPPAGRPVWDPGPLVPDTRHHCDTSDRQRTAQPDRFIKPHFYSWASVLLSFSLHFSAMRKKRRGRITTALCQRPLCLQGHWLVDVWCASSVVMTNFFLMWPILRSFFSSIIFCCWLTLWPALCHRKRQARACVDAYTFEYMSTDTKRGLVLFSFVCFLFILISEKYLLLQAPVTLCSAIKQLLFLLNNCIGH